MTSNFAFHRGSAAAAPRYNSPRPARRNKIQLREADDIGSCDHRVIEVASRNVFADRSAHLQNFIQIGVQAELENFRDFVVSQSLENFSGEPLGFIRIGAWVGAADGA